MAVCICDKDVVLRSSSTEEVLESSFRGMSFCVWPSGGIVGVWALAFDRLVQVVWKKKCRHCVSH